MYCHKNLFGNDCSIDEQDGVKWKIEGEFYSFIFFFNVFCQSKRKTEEAKEDIRKQRHMKFKWELVMLFFSSASVWNFIINMPGNAVKAIGIVKMGDDFSQNLWDKNNILKSHLHHSGSWKSCVLIWILYSEAIFIYSLNYHGNVYIFYPKCSKKNFYKNVSFFHIMLCLI